MESENRKIHAWAFPDECWHEFNNDCVCQKDGCCADNTFRNENPDYFHSPEACLRLIEAVRGKGYEDAFSFGFEDGGTYFVNILASQPDEERVWCCTTADTLPEAVANAVLKLVDE